LKKIILVSIIAIVAVVLVISVLAIYLSMEAKRIADAKALEEKLLAEAEAEAEARLLQNKKQLKKKLDALQLLNLQYYLVVI